MEKRGMSHIEVVLAFVLFISAVVFIFSIFNVQDATKFNESSLSYTKYEINKLAKVDLETLSVVLQQSAIASKKTIAVKFEDPIPTGKFLRVENYEGNELPSQISASREIIYVEIENNPNPFFKVYISEDLPSSSPTPSSTPTLDETLYTITSEDLVEIMSEKKLNELKARYDRDYYLLKDELKISDRIDFSINVSFSERDFINMYRNIPSRTEVSADNTREEVLRLNGKREFADVLIKVW